MKRITKVEKLQKNGSDWEISDFSIFGRGKGELLKLIEKELLSKEVGLIHIVTINTEFVVKSWSDIVLREILKKAEILVPDGIGLLWGAEVVKKGSYTIAGRLIDGFVVGVGVLTGKKYDQLVPGVDLAQDLVEVGVASGSKVMLLGGWGDRAEKAKDKLKLKAKKSKVMDYKKLVMAVAGEPMMSREETMKKIASFRPNILLVGMGFAKQEKWIYTNREMLGKLGVKIVIGVGRTFDYWSGELPRAPRWMRRMGFEWLYSLIRQPYRWRRQLALLRFILWVVSGKV